MMKLSKGVSRGGSWSPTSFNPPSTLRLIQSQLSIALCKIAQCWWHFHGTMSTCIVESCCLDCLQVPIHEIHVLDTILLWNLAKTRLLCESHYHARRNEDAQDSKMASVRPTLPIRPRRRHRLWVLRRVLRVVSVEASSETTYEGIATVRLESTEKRPRPVQSNRVDGSIFQAGQVDLVELSVSRLVESKSNSTKVPMNMPCAELCMGRCNTIVSWRPFPNTFGSVSGVVCA